MNRNEIIAMRDAVKRAYEDALDGKSVSFTGANGRAITNHDLGALRAELNYWERRARNRRGRSYSLANFNHR